MQGFSDSTTSRLSRGTGSRGNIGRTSKVKGRKGSKEGPLNESVHRSREPDCLLRMPNMKEGYPIPSFKAEDSLLENWNIAAQF